MKKSMCCNEDMIYMGEGISPIAKIIGAYIYCCYKCGKLEWSTEKEKTKYKWYHFKKEKLESLLKENKQ